MMVAITQDQPYAVFYTHDDTGSDVHVLTYASLHDAYETAELLRLSGDCPMVRVEDPIVGYCVSCGMQLSSSDSKVWIKDVLYCRDCDHDVSELWMSTVEL